jgi:phospholipase C
MDSPGGKRWRLRRPSKDGQRLRSTRKGDQAGCAHDHGELCPDFFARPVRWEEIDQLGGRPLTAAQAAAYAADRARWACPEGVAPTWQTRTEDDEAVNTHLWLCLRGLDLLARSDQASHQGMAIWLGNYRRAWQHGVWAADYVAPYCDRSWWGGYPGCKWFSHFYDPDTGKNWRGATSPTALTEGVRWWQTSQAEAREGQLFEAFFHLGLSLHYLTDLTQPMHAANFTFLSSFPPGYHTAFESFAATVQVATPRAEAGWYDLAGPNPADWLVCAARLGKGRMARIWDKGVRHYWHRLNTKGWQGLLEPVVAEALAEGTQIVAGYLARWWETVAD